MRERQLKHRLSILILIPCLINIISCIDKYKVKESLKENEERCRKFGTDNYFEPDVVVGEPWRIYYSWHWNLDQKCIDMRFKYVTPTIIDRFYNDMNEYMAQEPDWKDASLYLSMGKTNHEMLLFADNSTIGRFLGVSNVIRDGNLIPSKQGVPLLEFQLKLLRNGRYLVSMDCRLGVVSLAARCAEPPHRAEVLAAADELRLPGGAQACMQDTNQNENYVLPDEN